MPLKIRIFVRGQGSAARTTARMQEVEWRIATGMWCSRTTHDSMEGGGRAKQEARAEEQLSRKPKPRTAVYKGYMRVK